MLSFIPAIQDTLPPDTLDTNGAVPDTLQQGPHQVEEEEEEVVIVRIWNYEKQPGYNTLETDSTLRWMNTLSPVQRFHRYPGSITYRTGTLGRMDAIQMHTYENRHYKTELDGLVINDALTGAVNWNRVPVHKIRSMESSAQGPVYQTDIRLKDHYLVQPRTYLNFDESKYNFRNLEFSATHNITPKTNLELAYWDRRDDIGYNRSGVEGNQILFRAYHQLTDQWLMRGAYIINSMDQQQSFGYSLDNPSLFPFNPFIATPLENSAESEEGSKDLYVQAHFRPDTSAAVQTQLGLHYQTDSRSLTYSADTTATDFRQFELFARHTLRGGPAELQATVRPFFLQNRTNQLTESDWGGLRGDLKSTLNMGRAISVTGMAEGMVRNDSRYDMLGSGRVQLEPAKRFEVSLFGGYASRSPDLQALYWQSDAFSGNENLQNEESVTAGAETAIGLGSWFTIEARADMRRVENGVFVDRSGETEQFVNSDPYLSLSGTGTLRLDSRLFEGMASATYKTFESETSVNSVNQGLQASGDRVWLKGSFYWKNYLFDQATFVKAGLVGLYSPNFMRSAEYIPPLNRWQQGTQELLNPPFSRVDLDVSARIRWFMVLLRWENIFDRVTQRGYFETVGYPMPEQRLIFGLRILFTN
ncbi:MAG: putative porin [Balneolaceae bacterium]